MIRTAVKEIVTSGTPAMKNFTDYVPVTNAFIQNSPGTVEHSEKTNAPIDFQFVVDLTKYRPFDTFEIRIARLSPVSKAITNSGDAAAAITKEVPDVRFNCASTISQISLLVLKLFQIIRNVLMKLKD
jgi:hypothetical protein